MRQCFGKGAFAALAGQDELELHLAFGKGQAHHLHVFVLGIICFKIACHHRDGDQAGRALESTGLRARGVEGKIECGAELERRDQIQRICRHRRIEQGGNLAVGDELGAGVDGLIGRRVGIILRIGADAQRRGDLVNIVFHKAYAAGQMQAVAQRKRIAVLRRDQIGQGLNHIARLGLVTHQQAHFLFGVALGPSVECRHYGVERQGRERGVLFGIGIHQVLHQQHGEVFGLHQHIRQQCLIDAAGFCRGRRLRAFIRRGGGFRRRRGRGLRPGGRGNDGLRRRGTGRDGQQSQAKQYQ